jgi:predicted PurR-regulated permease PerM
MFRKRIKSKSWYPYTVAICAGVVLFVFLTYFTDIWDGIGTFIGYFAPVIWGCIIAYLINPLSKFYGRTIFCRIKNDKVQLITSNTVAFLTVAIILISVMILLIPELISSIKTFVGNIDQYVAQMDKLLKAIGLSSSELGLGNLTGSSGEILHNISDYVSRNMDEILETSANAGKTAVQWLIACMLSIYLLASKRHLKTSLKRFLKALLKEDQYEKTRVYLLRSHDILSRFVVFDLLDGLLVGIVNFIFMTALGMPYAWLISFVVALTNLVPTFGPFVGGGIGIFILVLVKPWYAVAFAAFTLILQLIDGYIIKPKLFGGSLGVPALWVLIAIVVGGKMFGVVGILVSVPLIAILHFTYNDYFLPWLEARPKDSGEPEP